jgi:hypothetical protein
MSRRSCYWLMTFLTGVALTAPTPTSAQDVEQPKAAPEFAVLKQMEGTWAITLSGTIPAGETKLMATHEVALGGLWLSGEHSGTFGGKPYRGKSLGTYDATKKKYVTILVDSRSTYPIIGEGTYDPETKSLTMTTEFPGPAGRITLIRTVTTFEGRDTMRQTGGITEFENREAMLAALADRGKFKDANPISSIARRAN